MSLSTSNVEDVTVDVPSAGVADGDPVLYVIFYIVQYLLDIEGKLIPPVDCRSLSKESGNYQQAYFRCS